MMLDILALFSDKQDLSGIASGVTTLSSKSYDTLANDANWPQALTSPASAGPAGVQGLIGAPHLHDIGRGRPVQLFVQATTKFSSGTNVATVEVDLITDTDQALATAKTVLDKTPGIIVTTLIAGYRWQYKTLPAKIPQRFVGVQYVTGGGEAIATPGGGAVSAGLVFGVDDHADILGA